MKKLGLIITMTALASGIAWADETAADAAKRGNAALKAGRVHEACDAFAASVKLEPKTDVQLSLADCYEQDGKLVTAAKLYREVADKDTNAGRKKTSLAKATKLEAKAPKLRFAINPKPEGLVLKVDGVEVPSNADLPVDAGPHEVTATAPGFEGHASAPVEADRKTLDVIVRLEAVAPPTPPKPEPTPVPETPTPTPTAEPTPVPETPVASKRMVDEPAPSASNKKRNGLLIGGVGVAALIGSGVFFALSSSQFDHQKNVCPTNRCNNDFDTQRALDFRKNGQHDRGAAIALGIGGGVLVITGAILVFTAPKASEHVAVQAGGGTYGLAFSGGF